MSASVQQSVAPECRLMEGRSIHPAPVKHQFEYHSRKTPLSPEIVLDFWTHAKSPEADMGQADMRPTWDRRNIPHDPEDSPEEVGSATASFVARGLAGQTR